MATNQFNNFISSLTKKPAAGTSLSSLNTGNTLSSFNQSSPVSTQKTPMPVGGMSIATPSKGKPTINMAPLTAGATNTTTPKLSPAGQSYASSLGTTQPAYDNVSGLLTDYGRSQGLPEVNAPKSTTTTTTQPKSEGAYIDYLKTLFNPEQVKLAQQSKESALQRSADAQAATEKAQLDARKGVEANLDREGGLKSGAQQSAQVYSRRAGDDIADLALAETAAARSAQIANDTYNTYINAGKSIYEAEQAAAEAKAATQEAFTLGEGQVRYDAQGNPIASGMQSTTDNEDNKLLSPSEAQVLGVPYGTTRSQAFGSSATGKPTAEQSKARQFAVSAKNANDILASVAYSPGAIQLPGPNLLKSAERQQFEQASRAFVNAVLRRESGATITDDEFNNKFRELIDQPGDAAAVKAQKKLARDAAVISIQEAGGEGVAQAPGQSSGSLYDF